METCLVIWGYRIKPECIADFERIYASATGDWAVLLRQASGYEGTQLLRQGDGHYVTIDRWSRRTDYDHFREEYRTRWEALYKRCSVLKAEAGLVGVFEILG